jgi:hypothetical protein
LTFPRPRPSGRRLLDGGYGDPDKELPSGGFVPSAQAHTPTECLCQAGYVPSLLDKSVAATSAKSEALFSYTQQIIHRTRGWRVLNHSEHRFGWSGITKQPLTRAFQPRTSTLHMSMNTSRLLSALVATLFVGIAQASVYQYHSAAKGVVVSAQSSATPGTPTAPVAPVAPPVPGAVSLSTATLDFGGVDVGLSSTKSVLLTNSGAGTLTLTAIPAITGAGLSASSGCGATLVSGGSCVTNVTFAPTTTSSVPGSLRFATNAVTSPNDVAVTGYGLQAIGALVNVSNNDFGAVAVGSSGSRSFTFTNSGNKPASISAALTGTGLTLSASSSCGTSAAPATITGGSSCTVTDNNSPSTAGTLSDAKLTLTATASGSPWSRVLTGSAISNPIVLTVTKAEYGGNAGADGNLTTKLKAVCDGKTSCTYQPYTVLGTDPYGGVSKDTTAEYSCGSAGNGRYYGVNEAGTTNQTIECSTLTTLNNGTITIISGTWGANRGGNNNLKAALTTACSGRKVCEFDAKEMNSGADPYPSQTKDLAVTYSCNGVTKSLTGVAGVSGRQRLICQ